MIEDDSEVIQQPVLGYLKTGAPSKGGIGKNQPFWRFQPDSKYRQSGELFREIYGDRPDSIRIYLPGHLPIEAYDEWMVEFGKKAKGAGGGYLKKRCTSKNIVLHLRENPAKGESPYSKEKIPCQKPNCACERHGTLQFYIVELYAKGYNQLVQFSTKSANHRSHIQGVLTSNFQFLQQLGLSLLGARFLLERVKEEISTPQYVKDGGEFVIKGGVRDKREEWMVRLRPDPEWMNKVMWEAYERSINSGAKAPLLILPNEISHPPAERMLTAAAVDEMRGNGYRREPDVMDVEVVEPVGEDEFLPADHDDKTNLKRLRHVGKLLELNDDALKTAIAMTFPGKMTVQLRHHHCDRVVDNLLIMWASQQLYPDGEAMFKSHQDAAAYYGLLNLADSSDVGKVHSWREAIDQLKRERDMYEDSVS